MVGGVKISVPKSVGYLLGRLLEGSVLFNIGKIENCIRRSEIKWPVPASNHLKVGTYRMALESQGVTHTDPW